MLAVVAPGCGVWREADRADTHSCVASIVRVFDAQAADFKPVLPVVSGWQRLSSDDSERLLTAVAKKATSLDCGGWKGATKLLDAWGHPILVETRERGDRFELRLRSLGPDGMEGTQDDVLVDSVDSEREKQIAPTTR